MIGEHLKIDLGSGNPEEGENQPKGFILQDIQPHKNITLVCDILDLDKHIKKGQCQHIRLSHVLEHFTRKEVVFILKMVYELLEDGGVIEVHVPNLKWHMQLLQENKDEEAVNYCFGSQKDEYDQHKTGFTPNILFIRLTEAGFTIDTINIEHSIHVLATAIEI